MRAPPRRGAHRGLAGSRTLRQFTAAVTPLLLGAYALFLTALAVLLALCGTALHQPAAYPQALTLGALLLPARLLTTRHHRRAPRVRWAPSRWWRRWPWRCRWPPGCPAVPSWRCRSRPS
ncbi:hypothetical protein ACFQ3Z_30475 [Streptomyces nogalater]